MSHSLLANDLLIMFDYYFLPFLPQGISYDHVELNYFLNGKSLQCPVTGIRGTVYPVFYGEGYLTELGCVHSNIMEENYWILPMCLEYT